MANETAPSERPRKVRSALFLETSKLLDRAEALQQSIEDRMRTASQYVLAGAMAAFVAVLFMGIFLAVRQSDYFSLDSIAIIFAAAAMLSSFIFFVVQQRKLVRRRIDRDQMTLFRIVDMLREVQGAVAAKTRSPLERAELKIRLAQFDIGKGEPFDQQDGGPNNPPTAPIL